MASVPLPRSSSSPPPPPPPTMTSRSRRVAAALRGDPLAGGRGSAAAAAAGSSGGGGGKKESRFLKIIREQKNNDYEEAEVPVKYKPKDHGDNSLKAWCKYWREGVFCDVALRCGVLILPAHRGVLAANSGVFFAMFTSDLAESSQREIDLSDSVDASSLESLVNFMYTGDLLVRESTVQDLMTSASFLGMENILNFCADFLKTKVTVENCLGIGLFARHLHLRHLHLTCRRFAEENFVSVASTEEFVHAPAELVKELIQSERLCVPTEVTVFHAVANWINSDAENRKPLLASLLKEVRLALLPREVLNKIFQDDLIQNDGDSYEYVREVRRETLSKDNRENNNSNNNKVTNKVKPRRADESNKAILVMSPGQPATLECFNVEDSIWTSKGTLYPEDVTGGLSVDEDDDESVFAVGSTCVTAFEPNRNKWQEGKTTNRVMRDARDGHCVVSMEGRIYAIGGTTLGFVEIFDRLRDRWDSASPMLQSRTGAAAAAFNGCIYVTGGTLQEKCVQTAERYDPGSDVWLEAPPMMEKRSGHALCVCGGFMYAVGGWNESGVLSSVERFNATTGSWVKVSELTEARRDFATVHHKGSIYAIGGRSERLLSSVERYDSQIDSWKTLTIKMTIAREKPVACLVDRPRWAM